LDDDGYSLGDHWWSIATARPLSDNAFYLTLDDGTTLWPAAPTHIRFQPEHPQRVAIDYTLLGDKFQGYDHAIRLNLLDTVLTKAPVQDFGIKNDSVYGKDPVKISAIWVGDGFLNVSFQTRFSGAFKHAVNLVNRAELSDVPYHLEFRHNAFGDTDGQWRSGLVAFDLSSLTSDSSTVKLHVFVDTYEGSKDYKLDYSPGKSSADAPEERVDNASGFGDSGILR
jgi:hypothetical protein